MKSRIKVVVLRKAESHQFMRDASAKPSWTNNDTNNSLDEFTVYVNGQERMHCECQSVSNHPEGRYRDTIASGPFLIKAFVDPRLFHGRIHGIVCAYDLEGEWIDAQSVQPTDPARWLIHDTQKLKPAPAGQLTRVAWSSGCIVLPPGGLVALGDIFDQEGVVSGTLVQGEIINI